MKLRSYLTKKRLLAVLMAASLAAYLAGPRVAAAVRPAAQVALVPFADGGLHLTAAVRGRFKEAFSPGLSQEDSQELRLANTQLTNEADQLRLQVRQQEQQIRDLQNFRGLYGAGKSFPREMISARVVMMDSLPYGATGVINVGSADGVVKGLRATERLIQSDRQKKFLPKDLPAVTDSALVGCVVESAAYNARLQLLTDRGFEIKARVLREVRNPRQIMVMPAGQMQQMTAANNLPIDVILRGDGAAGVIVKDVPKYHHILPGDRLVTRDEDYLLPAQVAIGKVTQVADNAASPNFVTLRGEPQADLGTLRYVYIVAPAGPEEGR